MFIIVGKLTHYITFYVLINSEIAGLLFVAYYFLFDRLTDNFEHRL